MKVYIVTRTDNFGMPRRIVEGGRWTKTEAEKLRQEILKRYDAPSRLCEDTEIDEIEIPGTPTTNV